MLSRIARRSLVVGIVVLLITGPFSLAWPFTWPPRPRQYMTFNALGVFSILIVCAGQTGSLTGNPNFEFGVPMTC